jgi:hypothetical protein
VRRARAADGGPCRRRRLHGPQQLRHLFEIARWPSNAKRAQLTIALRSQLRTIAVPRSWRQSSSAPIKNSSRSTIVPPCSARGCGVLIPMGDLVQLTTL